MAASEFTARPNEMPAGRTRAECGLVGDAAAAAAAPAPAAAAVVIAKAPALIKATAVRAFA